MLEKYHMKIMKFGGTSVGSGSKILHVAHIIKGYFEKERIVVVISAMCGVTDTLVSIYGDFKEKNFTRGLKKLRSLFELHINTLEELKFDRQEYETIKNLMKNLFGQLLTHLILQMNFSPRDYDYAISFGEKFSCLLLSKTLQKIGIQARTVDSSQIIVTTNNFTNARALLDNTLEQAEMVLWPLIYKGTLPVVTGFYGATEDGEIATLGRGGSDYSATILAYVLDAQEVILWKEVDGIFSGDPKKDKTVQYYKELSYNHALKLAQNGAKVLHREAMKPVMEKEIVVWVKNIFKPDLIGTKIWRGI